MKAVKRCVGIWIDARKAIIVTLEGESRSIQTMESEVRGHFRLSGGSRSRNTIQSIASEQKHNRRFEQKLKAFHLKVADIVAKANDIYLLGPSEAKIQLKKVMGGRSDTRHIPVQVETAQAMTEKQLVAKVERFFEPEKSKNNFPGSLKHSPDSY